MGRVVLTHSTYIKGLVAMLKELSKDSDIKTITPGVIARVKNNSRSSKIRIKISTKTIGGYKLIARLGTTVQEVFVTTELDKNRLESKINKIMI